MKSIVASLLVFLSFGSFAQKVVGYLPYYKGVSNTADYTLYTHLHYFAIWPAADGGLTYPSSQDSLGMANQFASLKTKVAGSDTKMILTFGGTAENGSEHFAEMAKNNTTRAIFIANAIELATAWGADGIDIDWEWGSPSSPQDDRDANGTLLTELRTACDLASLTLSVDISPSSYNGNNYDATKIAVADYINVMSYSYNGGWAATANHHTPLAKATSLGLDYWTGRGLDKAKLNIGTAFYGFKYQGTSDPATAFTSISTLNRQQVADAIASGYTIVEDDWNGTYCYSTTDDAIIFYDSPSNVEAKMDYAVDNGYSGVIIWEIGQDDASQTLSNAINGAILRTSEEVAEESTLFATSNAQGLLVSSENDGLLEIIDLSGQVLYSGAISKGPQQITLPQSSGIVIVKSISNNELVTLKVLRR
jgi:chitinase